MPVEMAQGLVIEMGWTPSTVAVAVAVAVDYLNLLCTSLLKSLFLLLFLPIATIKFSMKGKQLKLIPRTWLASSFAFGASLLKGSHPKKARPFRARLPLHIVLRSSSATGARSFLRFDQEIETLLEVQALRHHVRIYGAANAGNHLHLVVQAPSKEHLAAFLKAISGRIAQIVEGPAKEQNREAFRKPFWDARPYSRLISWGRDFKNVCRYIGINATETSTELSRSGTRQIFKEIREGLRSGWILKTPGLVAAGFG